MKTVAPQLGKKFSPGRLARHRESIARLKAAGHKFGVDTNPLTHDELRVCHLPTCAKEFVFRVRPKTLKDAGRYCCQRHAVQHVAILRMKVPDDYALLFDLYVNKNMTTPEIGKMFNTTHGAVRHRLKYLGILPRKVGASRNFVCSVAGCNSPVFKLKHPTNGSMYGTKCEPHYRAHRKYLHISKYEKKRQERGNIPYQVCRELAAGATTSQDVAKRLGLSVKVVCTTMGHLRRRGEVEPFGSVMVNRAPQMLWRLVAQEAIAC